jgi:hypothetical protein
MRNINKINTKLKLLFKTKNELYSFSSNFLGGSILDFLDIKIDSMTDYFKLSISLLTLLKGLGMKL